MPDISKSGLNRRARTIIGVSAIVCDVSVVLQVGMRSATGPIFSFSSTLGSFARVSAVTVIMTLAVWGIARLAITSESQSIGLSLSSNYLYIPAIAEWYFFIVTLTVSGFTIGSAVAVLGHIRIQMVTQTAIGILVTCGLLSIVVMLARVTSIQSG